MELRSSPKWEYSKYELPNCTVSQYINDQCPFFNQKEINRLCRELDETENNQYPETIRKIVDFILKNESLPDARDKELFIVATITRFLTLQVLTRIAEIEIQDDNILEEFTENIDKISKEDPKICAFLEAAEILNEGLSEYLINNLKHNIKASEKHHVAQVKEFTDDPLERYHLYLKMMTTNILHEEAFAGELTNINDPLTIDSKSKIDVRTKHETRTCPAFHLPKNPLKEVLKKLDWL